MAGRNKFKLSYWPSVSAAIKFCNKKIGQISRNDKKRALKFISTLSVPLPDPVLQVVYSPHPPSADRTFSIFHWMNGGSAAGRRALELCCVETWEWKHCLDIGPILHSPNPRRDRPPPVHCLIRWHCGTQASRKGTRRRILPLCQGGPNQTNFRFLYFGSPIQLPRNWAKVVSSQSSDQESYFPGE